ncbi:MAG: MFS transporter [Saprospiraceae bacterium]|nr:MFS transporter [Saprospiraceae bacterium]
MPQSAETLSKPSPESDSRSFRQILAMAALIIAGETVFLLPFVVPRIFRPTVLDVFGLNNLQLGVAFSVYGTVAMIAYFAGGPLADRFSARKLMAIALFTTSLGGILLASTPPLNVLMWLYGFWGLTTILLFWAALIRATREWGGNDSQGKAYGILDGGRGLVAALLASISVAIFSALLPVDPAEATLAQRTSALTQIIWIFTGFVVFAAMLVWFLVPEGQGSQAGYTRKKLTLSGVKAVVRLPAIWFQALIVLCAYAAFKGTDDFSLYAYDAFGYDDVAAARIGTVSFWVRPFAAIAAGLLGDRIGLSKVVLWSFILMMLGSLVIAFGFVPPGVYWLLVLTVAGTSLGIYALRGIYFALFQEANVPLAITGSAVGLVSVLGFTPDIFMGPIMGYLIDRSPGGLGHQHVFGLIAGLALVGAIATLFFRRLTQRENQLS